MDAWGEYDRWNAELASRYFSPAWEGVPTYLEPQDEILQGAAEAVGSSSEDPLSSLVAAVRPTLGLDLGSGHPLAEHRRRFHKWRRSLQGAAGPSSDEAIGPPPVVALLVVLVAAATQMGSDTSQAPHAYYPRLNQLLGVDGSAATRLKNSFQITEALWRGINEYLEIHEGTLGLPTAYALGHRYVGLPQSQALVRAGDRAKLPDFFMAFGLTPGSELVPADLERLLDSWIGQAPSPVSNNLSNLWRRGSARDRVCGIAAVELTHWDGSGRAESTKSPLSNTLNLTLLLRKTFGGRLAELSFVTAPRPGSDGRSLKVISADGNPDVGVIPAPGGRLRPTPGSKLDPASLAGSLVEVEDPLDGTLLRRRPRRVFVMRRDELVGAWTEVERIQLMEDFVVFIADDDKLVAQVLDLIEAHGDVAAQFGGPSDAQRDSLKGLPDGWVMLENVRLHAVPRNVRRVELQPLIPLTTAQLGFSGGLKLPGRIRKWSSLEPPEIRVAVAEAETITIRMWDLADDERELLDQWTEAAQAAVRPLEGLELEDGDYEIELYADDDKAPISASTLRLRSGDSPDLMTWETCARLNYELDTSGTGVLSAAVASGESEVLVDGVNTYGEADEPIPHRPLPPRPRWTSDARKTRGSTPPVVLGKVDPNSCAFTGSHYMEYPQYNGKPEGRVIEGVCRGCGLQKQSPARPTRRAQGKQEVAASTPLAVVAPRRRPTEVSWDSCLDALVHVGGGPISTLERIATQAEGSSLFVDEFVRTLEALGHIDVRRDDDLLPVEWEGNPAYLAEIPTSDFLLAGVWSAQARRDLQRLVADAGGSLEPAQGESGHLTSWLVRGVSVEDVESISGSLEDVYVVPDAVGRMIRVLPSLSSVEAALPVVGIPDYRSAERFDITAASWASIPGVAGSGAYRLSQSFRKVHLWVDDEASRSRQARLATVHLVKHLSAKAAGQPLTAYLPESQTLVVPLGAELPALYGRVLALCSGLPPVASPKQRVVAYRAVPRDIAEQMQHLLTS